MDKKEMADRRRIARYIRKGLKTHEVKESKIVFLEWMGSLKFRACVLGIAMIGKFGDAFKADRKFQETLKECRVGGTACAKVLGISEQLAIRISDAHAIHGWSVDGIILLLPKVTTTGF